MLFFLFLSNTLIFTGIQKIIIQFCFIETVIDLQSAGYMRCGIIKILVISLFG